MLTSGVSNSEGAPVTLTSGVSNSEGARCDADRWLSVTASVAS